MIIPAVIHILRVGAILFDDPHLSFRKLIATQLSSRDQLGAQSSLLRTSARTLTCTDSVFKASPAYITNLRCLTATLVYRLCCHGNLSEQGRREAALPHRQLCRSRSVFCLPYPPASLSFNYYRFSLMK